MRHRTWDFDIDRFLNPFIPPPPWKYLPYPLAHFLGYRRRTRRRPSGNLMPVFWAFIGIFSTILLIEAVSYQIPSFRARRVPTIVGSFGAAAVLEFYSIESPLAQPRNAIVGQLIASIVGVAVAKLFQLSGRTDIQWIGGALACASATALMGLTKTVHPPAGATALLAVVDANLARLGWFLIPVMMLGCTLMLAVALLINNLERQFPLYWWTSQTLAPSRAPSPRWRSGEEVAKPDAVDEDNVSVRPGFSAHCSDVRAGDVEAGEPVSQEYPPAFAAALDSTTGAAGNQQQATGEVVVRRGQIVVPQHMQLTQEERQVLEELGSRL